MLRLTAALTLATALLVVAPAASQDDEPLAPELLDAETLFVKQTLIDPKIVSRFRSEVAKWDRYAIVASEDDADLIATLSAAVDYTPTVADSGRSSDRDDPSSSGRAGETGPRPMGTVQVLDDIHLLITLPDGTEVWKDSIPAGSMLGNSSRKLAKRLQKRVEESEED
jgi:hypothetical protein